MNTRALDRELKRGSAELLILSLLRERPRATYDGHAPHGLHECRSTPLTTLKMAVKPGVTMSQAMRIWLA